MFKYTAFVKREAAHSIQEAACDDLQLAMSVVLDALGLVFDADACLGRSGFGNDEGALQTKRMVQHLVDNKNIDVYMRLLTDFLRAACAKYQRMPATGGVEAEKAFSQVARGLNVLVQRSEPSYPRAMMDKLHQFSIALQLALLMPLCRTPHTLKRPKMKKMAALCKSRILTLILDQVSDDRRFDAVFAAHEGKPDSDTKTMPYLWKFLMHVFLEQYTSNAVTPALMAFFSSSSSSSSTMVNFECSCSCSCCCIRTVFRW